MNIEIERRFLLKSFDTKFINENSGYPIHQIYFEKVDDNMIRYRLIDNQRINVCVKAPNPHGNGMLEYESEVKPYQREIYQSIVELIGRKHEVIKTRYNILYEGKLWELDVFDGRHKGLIIAEIELDDFDEPFKIPNFFNVNKEITGDKTYSNYGMSRYDQI
jgi:adenylate cyclase